MISFYLLWTLCYFVLLRWFTGKWPRRRQIVGFDESVPSVTLLVPLRNEMENLDSLALELKKIHYPALDIILVDDQSEDGTYSVLKEMALKDSRITVLPSPGIGKKTAIQFGVESATTELILCTDADCRIPESWVENMTAPFADPRIQMVCGPVITADQKSLFGGFQQIEWASVLLVTWFSFSEKKPLMCSGANLNYRKSAFEAVKGYAQDLHYLSGDDEFLLKKIVVQFGTESCVYLPYAQNLVFTKPQSKLSDLINQRVRWAGKWRAHRDWFHAFSAVVALLIQIVWLTSVMLLGSGASGILVFSAVWVGKILAERQSLGRVLVELGIRPSLIDFAVASVLHPIYVLLVALATFRGKFVWKGRTN
jgi:biofilm PGA synthesis N-glycosyltransferase PgaC